MYEKENVFNVPLVFQKCEIACHVTTWTHFHVTQRCHVIRVYNSFIRQLFPVDCY